jgi:hypothetical protein
VNRPNVRVVAAAVSIAWLGADSGFAREAPSSIREQLRDNGEFERIIVSSDARLTPASLVGQADLVVEASTNGGRSFLDASETHIYTDYTFVIAEVMKTLERPDLRAGSAITVRRESGTVYIDGRMAVSVENGFPTFDQGDRYILFLKYSPREKAYSVLGGSQGAFKAGEDIRSMAPAAAAGGSDSWPTSRVAFLGEMRALLRFTK